MIKGIVFRQRDKSQPEPYEIKVLNKLLASDFPDVEFMDAANLKEFERLIQTEHKIVIFNWSVHPSPTQIVEAYYQSAYGKSLFVPYFEYFKRGEKKFLEEYNCQEYVMVREPKREVSYADLMSKVRDVIEQKIPKIKMRKAQVGIHYLLYNDRADKAEELYKKLEKALPPSDHVFYAALFKKSRGDFAGAIEVIKRNPSATPKLVGLYGTLLHHIREHKLAIRYLQKANEISGLNLRRSFLLAKAYEQLSEENHELRKTAMMAYLAIYKLSPTYGGVTGKIVNLVMKEESSEHIPILATLLEQVPHRELMRIYKQLDKFGEPFRSAFTDVMITAMSKIANRMIQEDDLTALKYYKYIAKLIPDADHKRKSILDYCLARAYFRFGQLELAQQICSQVVEATNGSYEKAVALGKLITKALNGEFDVLLDDEKDWLILKKGA